MDRARTSSSNLVAITFFDHECRPALHLGLARFESGRCRSPLVVITFLSSLRLRMPAVTTSNPNQPGGIPGSCRPPPRRNRRLASRLEEPLARQVLEFLVCNLRHLYFQAGRNAPWRWPGSLSCHDDANSGSPVDVNPLRLWTSNIWHIYRRTAQKVDCDENPLSDAPPVCRRQLRPG